MQRTNAAIVPFTNRKKGKIGFKEVLEISFQNTYFLGVFYVVREREYENNLKKQKRVWERFIKRGLCGILDFFFRPFLIKG